MRDDRSLVVTVSEKAAPRSALFSPHGGSHLSKSDEGGGRTAGRRDGSCVCPIRPSGSLRFPSSLRTNHLL